MEAEVESRSTQSRTNATNAVDTRLGEINVPNAGAIHNPTIENEAKDLEKQFGSGTVRSIFSVFWCNTTEERDAEFERVVKVWPSCKYIIYGAVETTEENKKGHCHCLLCFASSKQWKTILKTLPSQKYHHKRCKKFVDAREYCWKHNPDDVREYGEPLQQGTRSDLKKLIEQGNHNPREIREIDPAMYSRYRNGILDVCKDYQHDQEVLEWAEVEEDENGDIIDKEHKEATVYWYYGPTGTGKTRSVRAILKKVLKDKSINKKNVTIITKIENGFAIGTVANETKLLILDEFRGSSMKLHELLNLINGCNVSIKGSQVWIKSPLIYVTSCYSPEECYPNQWGTDNIAQLYRRITEIVYFGGEEEARDERSPGNGSEIY